MKRVLLVALVLALPAGVAAPALAATVEVRVVEAEHHYTDSRKPEWRAIYEAAPGERNDVRVSAVWQGPFRFHDPRTPLTPGSGCRAVDAHAVECSLTEEHSRWDMANPDLSPNLSIAEVRAGDGDDLVRVAGDAGPLLVADGGTGDDTLTGGDQTGDELDGGGGGHDELFGRGNGDVLSDGDAGGPVDADVLDGGGAENDIVTYEDRKHDLRIDLADTKGDGERGEDDRLRGIEYAVGGAGDDDIGGGGGTTVLEGGPGDDHLDGEEGSDSLFGGPGDDRLHGHSGTDGLTGGPGRDQLRGDVNQDFFYDATSLDTLSCGERDDVLYDPGDVFVPADCDQLIWTFDGWPVRGEDAPRMQLDPHPSPSSSGRTLRFELGCTEYADGGGCMPVDGRLLVSSASGASLGSARIVSGWTEGEAVLPPVVVRLNARGRRAVARGRTLRVALEGKNLPDLRWRVRAR